MSMFTYFDARPKDEMRITAEEKQRTRDRILKTGRALFRERGFDATTTRDVAEAAGIATGTLFNYFPNKEALAMELLDEGLVAGERRFRRLLRGGESLEEELFAHVAAELRELKPSRTFAGPVFETAFSPFGRSDLARAGEEARVRHLECVGEILVRHGVARDAGSVAFHLYWTLYLGVLAFWSTDASRRQEDTLAVLDQSMRLFVGGLDETNVPPRGSR